MTDENNPMTMAQCRAREDWPAWKEAVKKELGSMIRLKVWSVVPRPLQRPVQCKWVFVKKLLKDGTLDKYKARLVAKGFTGAWHRLL